MFRACLKLKRPAADVIPLRIGCCNSLPEWRFFLQVFTYISGKMPWKSELNLSPVCSLPRRLSDPRNLRWIALCKARNTHPWVPAAGLHPNLRSQVPSPGDCWAYLQCTCTAAESGLQAIALESVMANQAIGILIQASFPGGIRMCKVYLRPRNPADCLVSCELFRHHPKWYCEYCLRRAGALRS